MTEPGVHLIEFDDYLKELTVGSDPAHEADILLLTCMDFRFFLKIAKLMKGIKYDHVILAGAALGAVVPAKKKTWQPTFFDHLGLARKLHNVQKVTVMEHRDCGAYGPKGFGLLPAEPRRRRERLVHKQQVAILRAMIPKGIEFSSLLLEVPPGRPKDALMFDKLV